MHEIAIKDTNIHKLSFATLSTLTFPDAVPPATPIKNGVFGSLGDNLPLVFDFKPGPLMPFVDGIKSGPLDIVFAMCIFVCYLFN